MCVFGGFLLAVWSIILSSTVGRPLKILPSRRGLVVVGKHSNLEDKKLSIFFFLSMLVLMAFRCSPSGVLRRS